jgi:hypothetical protein
MNRGATPDKAQLESGGEPDEPDEPDEPGEPDKPDSQDYDRADNSETGGDIESGHPPARNILDYFRTGGSEALYLVTRLDRMHTSLLSVFVKNGSLWTRLMSPHEMNALCLPSARVSPCSHSIERYTSTCNKRSVDTL